MAELGDPCSQFGHKFKQLRVASLIALLTSSRPTPTPTTHNPRNAAPTPQLIGQLTDQPLSPPFSLCGRQSPAVFGAIIFVFLSTLFSCLFSSLNGCPPPRPLRLPTNCPVALLSWPLTKQAHPLPLSHPPPPPLPLLLQFHSPTALEDCNCCLSSSSSSLLLFLLSSGEIYGTRALVAEWANNNN